MQTVTMNAVDALKQCTVEGNNIKLPPVQLDREIYLEVKKKLELIGGKWKGGKVQGFQFNENPGEYLAQLQVTANRDLKKEFQFFGTSDSLAARVIEYADINSHDLLVLEPSAGQGALVEAALKKQPGICVHGFELMEINRIFLAKIPDFILLGNNFLADITNTCYQRFDRIIANPPFRKNQDIDHICQMYLCCKPGGRIVSIASIHWRCASGRKEQQFREWLTEVNAEVIDVERGEFKESGTEVATVIIIINK